MPSYYDDSDELDDSASPTKAEEDKTTSKTKNERDDDMPTALIPKSLLAGKDFKPGDEIVFKIVHLYDDEAEIAYATGKDNKEESDESDRGDEMNNSMKSLEEAMS